MKDNKCSLDTEENDTEASYLIYLLCKSSIKRGFGHSKVKEEVVWKGCSMIDGGSELYRAKLSGLLKTNKMLAKSCWSTIGA